MSFEVSVLTRLSEIQTEEVMQLAFAAAAIDEMAPLSEHVLIHLHHGGDDADEHLVATSDSGKIIGYLHLDQTDAVAGSVVEVVVHPENRRQGVGRALVEAAIAKSEKFYHELGWWAVVVARFMPWARVLIPAIAGISRMNYYKFLSANFVGAIAWGVGLTLAGYYAATIPAVKTGSYAIASFFIIGSIVAGIRSWMHNRKAA